MTFRTKTHMFQCKFYSFQWRQPILSGPEKHDLSSEYGFKHGSERFQVVCWDPRTPRIFDIWFHLELVWKKLQSYSKSVQHLSAKIMKQGLRIAGTLPISMLHSHILCCCSLHTNARVRLAPVIIVINWWKSLQFCEGTFGIIITRLTSFVIYCPKKMNFWLKKTRSSKPRGTEFVDLWEMERRGVFTQGGCNHPGSKD